MTRDCGQTTTVASQIGCTPLCFDRQRDDTLSVQVLSRQLGLAHSRPPAERKSHTTSRAPTTATRIRTASTPGAGAQGRSALVQAIGYLEATGRDLASYADLLMQRVAELMKQNAPWDYRLSLDVAWQLSFERIEREYLFSANCGGWH